MNVELVVIGSQLYAGEYVLGSCTQSSVFTDKKRAGQFNKQGGLNPS